MMLDFESEPIPEQPFDVCLIGAGAAGIALARALAPSGLRLAVLESGASQREPATEDLQRSLVSGRPHAGVHSGRTRRFGGTTTIWGGQALPLQPIDFSHRSWVPLSGWPINEADVSPFYADARSIMGLGEPHFDTRISHFSGRTLPSFTPGTVEYAASQWSPRPDFARAYKSQILAATNVYVWQHANVREILPNGDGTRIASVEVCSLGGRRTHVRAKEFVLCAGGIESARLLLASRSHWPAGVGNAHDLVGRYFQDHASVACGWLHPLDRERLHDAFDLSYHGGAKFFPKILAHPQLQQRERILNALGNVIPEIEPDSLAQFLKDVARAVVLRKWNPVPRNGVRLDPRQLGSIVAASWRFLVRRRAFVPRSGPIRFEAHVEQEPNPESRLELSEECDALGMPRTRLNWKPTASSWRTARVFSMAAGLELERAGLARFESTLPARDDDDSAWLRITGDLNHHMGTTRMHADPRHGVVDSHCRVHGLPNLSIASSSVFPTGGSSNPTFTLLALAYRIAARLRAGLTGS